MTEIIDYDHKFAAYSVLIKFLELHKTENKLFSVSHNYFSLIHFLKRIFPHSISYLQRRSHSSKVSTLRG